jgi:hypothetical protein
LSRSGDGEYLIEMQRIGNTVKVTAVDPVTGMEASIVGPANAGRHVLSNNAVRKLQYVMNKEKKSRDSGGILA